MSEKINKIINIDDKKNFINISLKADGDLYEELTILSIDRRVKRQKDCSVSAVLREAAWEFIKKQKDSR